MQPKTTLIILILVYVISVVFNSLKTNGNSAHFAAPYLIVVFLFLCYAGLTAILTVQLYNSGTFQWISAHEGIRKMVLLIGTVSMLYTVFTAMMIKADWSTYQNQSVVQIRDFLAYSGYVWVPLLMIVPYFLVLHSLDEASNQRLIFKLPLILHAIMGCVIFVYMNIGSIQIHLASRRSESAYYIQQTLDKIIHTDQIEDYLFYTLPENEQVIRDAAFARFYKNEDRIHQLNTKLKNCHEMYSSDVIHLFLSVYALDEPDKLMEPFRKSMDCLAKQIGVYAANKYTSPNDLEGLQTGKILLAIEKQFVGREKMFFDKLTVLIQTLNAVKREDFREKTKALIAEIEAFMSRYHE